MTLNLELNLKSEDELNAIFVSDPEKLFRLCRVCLSDDMTNSMSLFSDGMEIFDYKSVPTYLWEMIALCGHVKLDIEDELPKAICKSCVIDLNIANRFRLKCQQADILLKKVLNQSTIKNETNEKEDVGLASRDHTKNGLYVSTTDLNGLKEELSDRYDDFNEDNIPLEKVKRKNKNLKQTKRNKKDVPEDDNVELIDVMDIKQEVLDDEIDVVHQKNKSKKKLIKKTKSKKKKLEVLEAGNIVLKIENGFDEVEIENDSIVGEDGDYKYDDNGETVKKYCCNICNKPLATKHSLEKHIENMHGEAKRLKIGIVSGYGANRRFHCPECDYKSRRRQALHYHVATHTGDRPYKCDECPKSFSQHGSLYTHKKTHSDKMYFTCPECGKQFKHRDVFRNHRRVHSTELKFVCKLCNKGLKTQKTLNEHMNRHLQIKNYCCDVCGINFVTRVELVNHLRIHGKIKKHKCSYCEYSSHSKKTLAVHILRHTGVRGFSCEHCDYTCYTKGELTNHTKKHTKEQNYPCPMCDMKFRHSSSLNKHMFRRHGEKYKWSNVVDRRVIK